MKRIIISFLGIVLLAFQSYSQKTLLTINGNEISNQEFERIYLKNNNLKVNDPTEIDEYLDLFINFKLKVYEAERLGYDTTKSFNDEYNKYLSQLAEPYFVDEEYEEQLIKQAYDRSTKEVRVSYILFKVENNDTLKAYDKANEAYLKLTKGEDFEKIAIEYSAAKNVKQDKGDAWFNPVFSMPYNLENFAYENKVGAFSKPILANNSYFILKVTGIRPSPGKIKASHIYIRLQENPTEEDSLKAWETVSKIQKELESGVSFEELAKTYSEDKFSATKGGDLGWFTTGKMLRPFEEASFGLEKIGDYTGPVRTQVGVHFILLTGRETIGSYEQEHDRLKKELTTKPQYTLIKEKIIRDLKKEYNYKQVSSLDKFYTSLDSTIFKADWVEDKFEGDNTVLVTFGDVQLTNLDFARYIAVNQKPSRPTEMKILVDEMFKNFVEFEIKEYELNRLPEKNENFKYLVKEYHDGLLLFDITNDMVWEKAVKDTTGLKNYFEQNKNKYYQKLNLVIYSYNDSKIVKKTLKLLKSKTKKNLSDSNIVEIINKKGDFIQLEQSGVFKEGDNVAVDEVIKMYKDNKITIDQNTVVLEDMKKIIYIKDNLNYVKGLVTADYQNVLEKQWIESLRSKAEITVNQEVFEEIKKNALK